MSKIQFLKTYEDLITRKKNQIKNLQLENSPKIGSQQQSVSNREAAAITTLIGALGTAALIVKNLEPLYEQSSIFRSLVNKLISNGEFRDREALLKVSQYIHKYFYDVSWGQDDIIIAEQKELTLFNIAEFWVGKYDNINIPPCLSLSRAKDISIQIEKQICIPLQKLFDMLNVFTEFFDKSLDLKLNEEEKQNTVFKNFNFWKLFTEIEINQLKVKLDGKNISLKEISKLNAKELQHLKEYEIPVLIKAHLVLLKVINQFENSTVENIDDNILKFKKNQAELEVINEKKLVAMKSSFEQQIIESKQEHAKEIQQYHNNLSEIKTSCEKTVEEKNIELNHKNNEIKELKNENENLHAKMVNVQIANTNFESQIKNLNQLLESQKVEISRLQQNESKFNFEAQNLNSEKNRIDEKNTILTKQIADLQTQVSTLQTECDSSKQLLKQELAKNAEFQKKIELECKSKITKMEQDDTEYKFQLKENQKIIDRHQIEINELKKENEDKQKMIEELNKIDDSKFSKLNEEYTLKLKDNQKIIDEYKSQIDEDNKKIEELNKIVAWYSNQQSKRKPKQNPVGPKRKQQRINELKKPLDFEVVKKDDVEEEKKEDKSKEL